MKALVTGATGFIGGQLCAALCRDGYEVRALVRSTSNTSSLLTQDIELIQGDVRDRVAVEQAVRGCDSVFHFAASFRREVPRREIWSTNVTGLDNLLSAAVAANVGQFIHCSSTSVYGLNARLPTTERSPFVPIPEDLYQESKLAAEELVRTYSRAGRLAATIVRTTGVYGPPDLRFLKLFRPIAKGRFVMIGEGRVPFSMIYIDDLIDGIKRCAKLHIAKNNDYLLTGDNPISLNETAATIAQAAGVPPPRWHVPVMPLYYLSLVMELVLKPLGISPPLYRRRVNFFRISRGFENLKAKRELGWEPRTSLLEGAARMLQWYQANGYISSK